MNEFYTVVEWCTLYACVYGCRKQQLYPEFFDLFAVVLFIYFSIIDLDAIVMNLLHNL